MAVGVVRRLTKLRLLLTFKLRQTTHTLRDVLEDELVVETKKKKGEYVSQVTRPVFDQFTKIILHFLPLFQSVMEEVVSNENFVEANLEYAPDLKREMFYRKYVVYPVRGHMVVKVKKDGGETLRTATFHADVRRCQFYAMYGEARREYPSFNDFLADFLRVEVAQLGPSRAAPRGNKIDSAPWSPRGSRTPRRAAPMTPASIDHIHVKLSGKDKGRVVTRLSLMLTDTGALVGREPDAEGPVYAPNGLLVQDVLSDVVVRMVYHPPDDLGKKTARADEVLADDLSEALISVSKMVRTTPLPAEKTEWIKRGLLRVLVSAVHPATLAKLCPGAAGATARANIVQLIEFLLTNNREGCRRLLQMFQVAQAEVLSAGIGSPETSLELLEGLAETIPNLLGLSEFYNTFMHDGHFGAMKALFEAATASTFRVAPGASDTGMGRLLLLLMKEAKVGEAGGAAGGASSFTSVRRLASAIRASLNETDLNHLFTSSSDPSDGASSVNSSLEDLTSSSGLPTNAAVRAARRLSNSRGPAADDDSGVSALLASRSKGAKGSNSGVAVPSLSLAGKSSSSVRPQAVVRPAGVGPKSRWIRRNEVNERTRGRSSTAGSGSPGVHGSASRLMNSLSELRLLGSHLGEAEVAAELANVAALAPTRESNQAEGDADLRERISRSKQQRQRQMAETLRVIQCTVQVTPADFSLNETRLLRLKTGIVRTFNAVCLNPGLPVEELVAVSKLLMSELECIQRGPHVKLEDDYVSLIFRVLYSTSRIVDNTQRTLMCDQARRALLLASEDVDEGPAPSTTTPASIPPSTSFGSTASTTPSSAIDGGDAPLSASLGGEDATLVRAPRSPTIQRLTTRSSSMSDGLLLEGGRRSDEDSDDARKSPRRPRPRVHSDYLQSALLNSGESDRLPFSHSDGMVLMQRERKGEAGVGMRMLRDDPFMQELQRRMSRIVAEKSIFDAVQVLRVLVHYMQRCRTRSMPTQVLSSSVDTLLSIKSLVFNSDNIRPDRIENVLLVHYVLAVLDELMLQCNHPPTCRLLFALMVEDQQVERYLRYYAKQILLSATIEEALLKMWRQFFSTERACMAQLLSCRRQIVAHYDVCMRLIKGRLGVVDGDIEARQAELRAQRARMPVRARLTTGRSLLGDDAQLNDLQDRRAALVGLVAKYEFLVAPGHGYVQAYLLKRAAENTLVHEYPLVRQMLRFLANVFSVRDGPFLAQRMYADSYVADLYIWFLKFYHGYAEDSYTIDIMTLLLKVLLMFAENATEAVREKFFGLSVVPFFMNELSLEYSIIMKKNDYMRRIEEQSPEASPPAASPLAVSPRDEDDLPVPKNTRATRANSDASAMPSLDLGVAEAKRKKSRGSAKMRSSVSKSTARAEPTSPSPPTLVHSSSESMLPSPRKPKTKKPKSKPAPASPAAAPLVIPGLSLGAKDTKDGQARKATAAITLPVADSDGSDSDSSDDAKPAAAPLVIPGLSLGAKDTKDGQARKATAAITLPVAGSSSSSSSSSDSSDSSDDEEDEVKPMVIPGLSLGSKDTKDGQARKAGGGITILAKKESESESETSEGTSTPKQTTPKQTTPKHVTIQIPTLSLSSSQTKDGQAPKPSTGITLPVADSSSDSSDSSDDEEDEEDDVKPMVIPGLSLGSKDTKDGQARKAGGGITILAKKESESESETSEGTSTPKQTTPKHVTIQIPTLSLSSSQTKDGQAPKPSATILSIPVNRDLEHSETASDSSDDEKEVGGESESSSSSEEEEEEEEEEKKIVIPTLSLGAKDTKDGIPRGVKKRSMLKNSGEQQARSTSSIVPVKKVQLPRSSSSDSSSLGTPNSEDVDVPTKKGTQAPRSSRAGKTLSVSGSRIPKTASSGMVSSGMASSSADVSDGASDESGRRGVSVVEPEAERKRAGGSARSRRPLSARGGRVKRSGSEAPNVARKERRNSNSSTDSQSTDAEGGGNTSEGSHKLRNKNLRALTSQMIDFKVEKQRAGALADSKLRQTLSEVEHGRIHRQQEADDDDELEDDDLLTPAELLERNQLYLLERKERKVYSAVKLHCNAVLLVLSLAIGENGGLDPHYSDQYPLNTGKLNIPFLLSSHLMHPQNGGVIPLVVEKARRMKDGVVRLVKLLTGRLFQAESYRGLTRMAIGAYGTVYKCDLKDEGLELAIKLMEVPKTIHDRCVLHDIFTEIQVLDRLQNDGRVTKLIDYGVDEDYYWVVMQRYKTSLRAWRRRQTAPLASNLKLYIAVFRRVLDAMTVCIEDPEFRFNHFDLKCDNVLLEGDPNVSEEEFWSPSDSEPRFRVCLADFGESLVYVRDEDGYTTHNRGTEFNKSPEMLNAMYANQKTSQKYDRRKRTGANKSADMWALGCLFYELLTGEFLFYDNDWVRFFIRVTYEGQPLLTSDRLLMIDDNPHLVDFFNWIFVRNPAYRPGLEEIMGRVDQLAREVERDATQQKPRWALLRERTRNMHQRFKGLLPPANDGDLVDDASELLLRERNRSLFDGAATSRMHVADSLVLVSDGDQESTTLRLSTQAMPGDTRRMSAIPNARREDSELTYFMQTPTEVSDDLLLAMSLPSTVVLKSRMRVTHIVHCCVRSPVLSDDFENLDLPQSRWSSRKYVQSIFDTIEFILLARQGRVLVYDGSGSPESPIASAFITAFLVRIRRQFPNYRLARISLQNLRYVVRPSYHHYESLGDGSTTDETNEEVVDDVDDDENLDDCVPASVSSVALTSVSGSATDDDVSIESLKSEDRTSSLGTTSLKKKNRSKSNTWGRKSKITINADK